MARPLANRTTLPNEDNQDMLTALYALMALIYILSLILSWRNLVTGTFSLVLTTFTFWPLLKSAAERPRVIPVRH